MKQSHWKILDQKVIHAQNIIPKRTPRLSVMVLLHVGYCESLTFEGEEERNLSSLLRLLEVEQCVKPNLKLSWFN